MCNGGRERSRSRRAFDVLQYQATGRLDHHVGVIRRQWVREWECGPSVRYQVVIPGVQDLLDRHVLGLRSQSERCAAKVVRQAAEEPVQVQGVGSHSPAGQRLLPSSMRKHSARCRSGSAEED